MAFHAGALLALAEDLEWDARSATRVVGTSAGALTGALLRLGLEGSDVCALMSQAPDEYTDTARTVAPPSLIDLPEIPSILRSLRLPSPLEARRLASLAYAGPLAFGALGLLRPGLFDLAPHLLFLGDSWPEDDLQVIAVRASDAKRVVLNRSSNVAFHAAVSASCAVPGVMQRVVLGHDEFADGGVASPTNADLAVDRARRSASRGDTGTDPEQSTDADAAIVISPMSGDAARTVLGRTSRRQARARLASELRSIRGIPTVVIEPHGALSEAILDDALSSENAPGLVSRSFIAVGAFLSEHRAFASAS